MGYTSGGNWRRSNNHSTCSDFHAHCTPHRFPGAPHHHHQGDWTRSECRKENLSRYQAMYHKESHYYHRTLLLLLTLFGLVFQGSDGVKDVMLEGSRYARRREDLLLRCHYNLETDSLYAVKWYRDSNEFYRFIPKESPPKQAFNTTGILVDLNQSDDHNVFIKNISFQTNGRFKCVISAEGTFQTLENAKDIEVVVIDYNSPKLFLDKMSYQPGDRGLANCTIEKTFPAPNITWFINGKQVKNISVMTKVLVVDEDRLSSSTTTVTTITSTYPTTTTSDSSRVTGLNVTTSTGPSYVSKLTSTVSTLHFPIQTYSPLTIKCNGQLFDIYNETTSILIQPKAPLLYPYPQLSTPKSKRKYGLPDQLQTFNATAFSKGGVQLKPWSSLLPFMSLTFVIIVTAQFFQSSKKCADLHSE